MSIAPEKTTFTPDELLAMPDGNRYELVAGQLVEREMGFHSGRVGGELFWHLRTHCHKSGLGWVLNSEAGYTCFADDPNKVRKPDVSFIRAERLAAADEPQGWADIAPDLAVEVISPNDLSEKVSIKVSEYLEAGVKLVWVIHPATQSVEVHRSDGRGTILSNADELDGDDVVPGFRCKVSELFRPPKGVT